MMGPLAVLPHVWLSIDLPGYREHWFKVAPVVGKRLAALALEAI